MITNFMYPEDKKKNYFIIIPKPPELFDYFDVFRIFVCLGAITSLCLYEMYIAVFFASIITTITSVFITAKLIINLNIREHNNCLVKLKKIYDTPAYQEEDEKIIFTFIAPSDNLVNKTTQLARILKKN